MRALMVAMLVVALAIPAAAGNNTSSSRQSGTARSGDAVGGPGVVVFHRGDIELEAVHAPESSWRSLRRSRAGVVVTSTGVPTAVETGSAGGGNHSAIFVGTSFSRRSLVADLLG